MVASRFAIVGWLSSAARMPLPGATRACATVCSDSTVPPGRCRRTPPECARCRPRARSFGHAGGPWPRDPVLPGLWGDSTHPGATSVRPWARGAGPRQHDEGPRWSPTSCCPGSGARRKTCRPRRTGGGGLPRAPTGRHRRPVPRRRPEPHRRGCLRAGERAVRRDRRHQSGRQRSRAVHPRRHRQRRGAPHRAPARGQGPAGCAHRRPQPHPAARPQGRRPLGGVPAVPPADAGVPRASPSGSRDEVFGNLYLASPDGGRLRRGGRAARLGAGRDGRRGDRERPALRGGPAPPGVARGLDRHDPARAHQPGRGGAADQSPSGWRSSPTPTW